MEETGEGREGKKGGFLTREAVFWRLYTFLKVGVEGEGRKKWGGELQRSWSFWSMHGTRRPKRVGDFVLGRVLGEGCYGLVREGYVVSMEKVVAVKCVKRRLLAQRKEDDRTLRHEIGAFFDVDFFLSSEREGFGGGSGEQFFGRGFCVWFVCSAVLARLLGVCVCMCVCVFVCLVGSR